MYTDIVYCKCDDRKTVKIAGVQVWLESINYCISF